jgi:hypothetical protein
MDDHDGRFSFFERVCLHSNSGAWWLHGLDFICRENHFERAQIVTACR